LNESNTSDVIKPEEIEQKDENLKNVFFEVPEAIKDEGINLN